MKYIVIIFSFLMFSSFGGQTTSLGYLSEQKVLTPQELKTAKELYIRMMNSETYKLQKKNTDLFKQKLNGVKIYPEGINVVAIEEQMELSKKILKDNIAKTKFKSYKEAADLMEEGSALTAKMKKENEELFAYMKRASAEQIKEILEPEFTSKRESLYN